MLVTPKANGFADHYPYEKWLFHWGYTPFSDIPICGITQLGTKTRGTKTRDLCGILQVLTSRFLSWNQQPLNRDWSSSYDLSGQRCFHIGSLQMWQNGSPLKKLHRSVPCCAWQLFGITNFDTDPYPFGYSSICIIPNTTTKMVLLSVNMCQPSISWDNTFEPFPCWKNTSGKVSGSSKVIPMFGATATLISPAGARWG